MISSLSMLSHVEAKSDDWNKDWSRSLLNYAGLDYLASLSIKIEEDFSLLS